LYTVGRQRTTVQDAGFGVWQIVDIALKALSPGINDTTTAVTCVHYLTYVVVVFSILVQGLTPRPARINCQEILGFRSCCLGKPV